MVVFTLGVAVVVSVLFEQWGLPPLLTKEHLTQHMKADRQTTHTHRGL